MLKVRNLSIGYGGKPLARGIGFELAEGTVTALLGCNGVGKSTLFKTISGELPAIAGAVEIDGKDIRAIPRREMARLTSLVTTDRVTAEAMTVRQTVSLGRQPHTGFFGRLSADDRAKVEEAMRDTAIRHKADSFLTSLSDGERQKAMIARALAQDTPLLLLDEPFSFLDVSARIEILALLKELAARTGKCVLFSSHDVAQALRMADHILLFTPGRELISGSAAELVADGTLDRLFDNPAVRFSPALNDFISS